MSLEQRQLSPPLFAGPSPVSARRFFLYSSPALIVFAQFQGTGMRILLTLIGLSYVIASDKIKDTEKAKKRASEETETRIRLEMAKGFEQSLSDRYAFTTAAIGDAFANAMNRIAVTVKDASPTRAANLRVVAEDDAD